MEESGLDRGRLKVGEASAKRWGGGGNNTNNSQRPVNLTMNAAIFAYLRLTGGVENVSEIDNLRRTANGERRVVARRRLQVGQLETVERRI